MGFTADLPELRFLTDHDQLSKSKPRGSGEVNVHDRAANETLDENSLVDKQVTVDIRMNDDSRRIGAEISWTRGCNLPTPS